MHRLEEEKRTKLCLDWKCHQPWAQPIESDRIAPERLGRWLEGRFEQRQQVQQSPAAKGAELEHRLRGDDEAARGRKEHLVAREPLGSAHQHGDRDRLQGLRSHSDRIRGLAGLRRAPGTLRRESALDPRRHTSIRVRAQRDRPIIRQVNLGIEFQRYKVRVAPDDQELILSTIGASIFGLIRAETTNHSRARS